MSDTAAAYISLDDVTKAYSASTGSVQAIDNVTLRIAEGEFVSILGPSGCGKSTLLMIVAGLEPATDGSVVVNGKDIDGPVTEVGIVFQRDVLLAWRSVLSNILLQAEMRRMKVKSYVQRARELLTAVNMSDVEKSYPAELSGGMRQRVAICRALVHDPPLLLMDEPFAALDALTRERMSRDLESLWQTSKSTVVFVTHSIEEAVTLSDRIIVMSPRPSSIAHEFLVDLPRPRDLEMRDSVEFQKVVRSVRHALHELGVV